jgi:hypothetical protein
MTFGKPWSMAVFERIDENQRGSHNLVMLSTVNRQQLTTPCRETETKPQIVTGGIKNRSESRRVRSSCADCQHISSLVADASSRLLHLINIKDDDWNYPFPPFSS